MYFYNEAEGNEQNSSLTYRDFRIVESRAIELRFKLGEVRK